MFNRVAAGKLNDDQRQSGKKAWAGVLVTLAVLLAGDPGLAQPALSVNPAITSNSYPGVVTLSITGLNNGEKVAIQRWIDNNANGRVDAGEPMMDTFKVTDNDMSNALIGGITNLNVPFDANPTLGAVTTMLSFAQALTLENMVGHYVYWLVSPTGRFAPVSATFVVTNGTQAQSISGIVYSNGATPFPNAIVVAQDQQKNNPVGAVVADSSGHYTLSLPPSSYNLIAAAPNCFFDQSLAPSLTLTNGMTATTNLYLTNGTATITGTMYDAATSNGIGGLLLTLQSAKLFAVAFTDTNGNYSAAVTPSFWKIIPSKQRLARRAYVLPEATFQVNASSGLATNANLALPRGYALFYGRILDNSNTPYANIEVDASAGNNFDAKGYSDATGSYAVAVLGDTTNAWSCNVNSAKNDALANYILNQFPSLTLSSNQTVLETCRALPATGRISGHVEDNSGKPVTGVGLMAVANIGGDIYQTLSGTTDNSGNYSLAAAAGEWSMQFFTGNSGDTLDTQGYADLLGPHSTSLPPTNATLNITVYPLGTPLISQPQRSSPTQFGFTISGATNVNYTVQVSTNLASTNWFVVSSFQFTTNPFPITDLQATNSPRFYRVLKN